MIVIRWQKAAIRILPLASILLVPVAMFGCHMSPRAANPQWLADFERADSITIQTQGQSISIADKEALRRLEAIYTEANWKAYRHTLPGNVNDRTITLLDDGNALRRFSYTGELWETNSYTENRTAVLTDADRQWVESLFSTAAARQTLHQ